MLIPSVPTFAADTTSQTAYKDGTYEGSGSGFGRKVTLRVTIQNGKITSIKEAVRVLDKTNTYISLLEKLGAKAIIKNINLSNININVSMQNLKMLTILMPLMLPLEDFLV